MEVTLLEEKQVVETVKAQNFIELVQSEIDQTYSFILNEPSTLGTVEP